MNKAIITGSTGLVGRAVARHLSDFGVDVLCLGRQSLSQAENSDIFGGELPYLNIAMEEILSLPALVKAHGWMAGSDCVFYHFAWGGHERLTDGSFGEQLHNAIYAANAVKAAKQLGCKKFVNSGTIEETYLERYLSGERGEPYHSSQINYTLAKIASRDMCKIVAYLEKLDYVHTRLSVPLDPELSMGSYIAATLRRIRKGEPYDAPVSNKLFDIISTNLIAKAYRLIGQVGKNKADYFIGTGNPVTLSQFFKDFAELATAPADFIPKTGSTEVSGMFAIDSLVAETGFRPSDFLRDFQNIHSRKF